MLDLPRGAGIVEECVNDRELERIIKSRRIVISEDVNSTMAGEITRLVTYMEQEDPKAPILVTINSPGGEAYTGLGIHDTLQFTSCPVYTLVNGLCASAGIVILLSGEQGRRVDDRGVVVHAVEAYRDVGTDRVQHRPREVLIIRPTVLIPTVCFDPTTERGALGVRGDGFEDLVWRVGVLELDQANALPQPPEVDVRIGERRKETRPWRLDGRLVRRVM